MQLIYLFIISGRGGSAGGKFRISLACPVGAVMNCADNTGMYNYFNLSQSNWIFIIVLFF